MTASRQRDGIEAPIHPAADVLREDTWSPLRVMSLRHSGGTT